MLIYAVYRLAWAISVLLRNLYLDFIFYIPLNLVGYMNNVCVSDTNSCRVDFRLLVRFDTSVLWLVTTDTSVVLTVLVYIFREHNGALYAEQL